jgi:phage shock protein A
MKRADLTELLKLKDDELASLTTMSTHVIENLTAQRDDSIKRLQQLDKDKEDAVKRWEQTNSDVTIIKANYDDTIKQVQKDCDDRVNKAIEALKNDNAQLRKQLADAQELITTLGGTELGKKMAVEAKKAELKRIKDEADRKLKELDKG